MSTPHTVDIQKVMMLPVEHKKRLLAACLHRMPRGSVMRLAKSLGVNYRTIEYWMEPAGPWTGSDREEQLWQTLNAALGVDLPSDSLTVRRSDGRTVLPPVHEEAYRELRAEIDRLGKILDRFSALLPKAKNTKL